MTSSINTYNMDPALVKTEVMEEDNKFLQLDTDGGPPSLVPVDYELTNFEGIETDSDSDFMEELAQLDPIDTFSNFSETTPLIADWQMVPQDGANVKKEIVDEEKPSEEQPMLSFEDFYLISGPSNSSNPSLSPGGETPSRIQSLLDDPLVLQDLVMAEKSRAFDQDIELSPPVGQPCQLVAWNRFRNIYLIGRVHIRFKQSPDPLEESVVLVMRPEDQLRFCHLSKDVKAITDWIQAPPFLTDLVNPLSSDKFAGYALLIYNTSLGWELAGRLTPFSDYEMPGNLSSFQEQIPESAGILNTNLIPIKIEPQSPAESPVNPTVSYEEYAHCSADAATLTQANNHSEQAVHHYTLVPQSSTSADPHCNLPQKVTASTSKRPTDLPIISTYENDPSRANVAQCQQRQVLMLAKNQRSQTPTPRGHHGRGSSSHMPLQTTRIITSADRVCPICKKEVPKGISHSHVLRRVPVPLNQVALKRNMIQTNQSLIQQQLEQLHTTSPSKGVKRSLTTGDPSAQLTSRSHSANGQHIVISTQNVKKRSRLSISTSDASNSSDGSLTPPPLAQTNELVTVVLTPPAPIPSGKGNAVAKTKIQGLKQVAPSRATPSPTGMPTTFANSLLTSTIPARPANVQTTAPVINFSQPSSSASFTFTPSSSFATQAVTSNSQLQSQLPRKRSKVCIICHKEVEVNVYYRHLTTHDPSTWMRCAHCNFITDAAERLKAHTIMIHAKHCKNCDHVTFFSSDLENHMRTVHADLRNTASPLISGRMQDAQFQLGMD